MRALFTLALLAIVHFSLFPWHFARTLDLTRPLPWYGITRANDWQDVIINLAFYLPPALIGQWAFQKTNTKLRTFLLIVGGFILLSFTLETLQFAIPTRFANLRDVLCNALGAFTGALIAVLIPNPFSRIHPGKFGSLISPLALFLTAWITWQAFPFLPHLSLYRLLHPTRNPTWPDFAFTEMADVTFALLVVYLAALHLQLPALRIALLASLLLPAQALLRDLTLSPPRLAAAALALLAAATLFRRPTRLHFLTLASLITLWILIRQIAPIQFADHPLNAFAWLPFGTFIEIQSAAALRTLAGKFLLYAAAIWLWHRTGLPVTFAACAIFLLLAITEALQIYLPRRTPESTDALLALLAAFLLKRRKGPSATN